jgi:dTDP-4-dehydrorhamnose reductase
MAGMTNEQIVEPVLVVGASGAIGAALAASLERCKRRVAQTSRTGCSGSVGLDLSRNADSWPVPSGIVTSHLCAAVTSIEYCQSHPNAAWAVNVEGTVTLARRLIDAGSRVVFPSTNMVFSGEQAFVRHNAERAPRSAYGRMKAEAEVRLLELGDRVRVVRLSKVLGRRFSLFEGWRAALAAGMPIYPFSDMVIAPISLTQAVDALVKAGDSGYGGIYQLSACSDISYADIARRLADSMGADPMLVQPRSAAHAGSIMDRVARHTTLEACSAGSTLWISAPNPWQAVNESLGL